MIHLNEDRDTSYSRLSKEMMFARGKATIFLTLLFVLIVGFYRKPDAFLNPQFWAEDGTIFFNHCLQFGFHSIFLSFVGYFHTIPRLIAYAASFFPYSIAPAIYNYSALAAVLVVCAKLFSSRLHLKHKPLFAIAMVLVPYSFLEGFMNITNVQFYLAPLLLILFLQDAPRSKYQLCMDFVTLVLIGLTGPFIILSLPLFIVRCVLNRTPYNYALCFTAIVLVIIQGHEIIIMPVGRHLSGDFLYSIDPWIDVFGFRLFGEMFLGRLISNSINIKILAILSLCYPLLILFLTDFKKDRMYLVISFLYFGFSVVFAVLYKFRSIPFYLIGQYAGQHYFYVPYLMVMWGLITCLDSSKIKKRIAIIMLGLMLMSSFTDFQWPALKDNNWKEYSKQIKPGVPMKIPTTPRNFFIHIK